ncbi:endosome-associated-trafficking regulator 1 isoform 2-T2 [Pelodytes ibericus]
MSGFSKPPKAKSLLIEDDCNVEDEDDANPFSFKQFVKTKTRPVQNSADCDGGHSKVLDTSCLEYEEPFFKDPTVYESLVEDEEEEEDWQGSYHPSVVEHTHDAYEESYDYSASDLSGGEPFNAWNFAVHASPSSAGYPTKAEPLLVTPSDSADNLQLQTLQINYEEVQDENGRLKRTICDLKERNKTQTEKVKQLERKLEERLLEEQKEAQDLESMVQQVEKNLQMMTKRAAKAESNVTQLKQEVALLQIQLGTYKAENEALRRGETAGMNAVKQNTSLALENLYKAVSGAQTSIKQLMSGAESLNLVAELLRSIDRIAEVHEDDGP